MTEEGNSGTEASVDAASVDTETLLRSLLRKEGNWVEWGQSCQQLQKSGYTSQAIFEATGFQPIHQNQLITAAQVYASLVSGATAAVLSYFNQQGSEVLYEFRILAQTDRISAATLAWEKKLDSEAANDLAKALKDFSRLSSLPDGFSQSAGDAMAYQCWKLARQQADLQERSRSIARGLSYAQSETARQQIEKLLTDFTVVKSKPAPRLPLYRLETEEEMPRLIPVVGRFPLTKADLQTVPLLEEVGPYRMIQFSGSCAWVGLPGWQAVLNADDPIGILTAVAHLPAPIEGETGEVLLVIDRQQREWQSDSYFLVEQTEGTNPSIEMKWFETAPPCPLLGKVILVLRPKRILDESVTLNPWLIDE